MYGRHFLEISPIFFSSWRRERVKIRSRAHHTVNSWKKERDDGLQANCYYELISCVLVNLKRANYSESTPISNEPLR